MQRVCVCVYVAATELLACRAYVQGYSDRSGFMAAVAAIHPSHLYVYGAYACMVQHPCWWLVLPRYVQHSTPARRGRCARTRTRNPWLARATRREGSNVPMPMPCCCCVLCTDGSHEFFCSSALCVFGSGGLTSVTKRGGISIIHAMRRQGCDALRQEWTA
jgi:hypothetical protein